jgi:hypothetical protein
MRALLPMLGLVCLVYSGCKDADHADLVPVTGTVTLDGKDLANATVWFTPVGETKGQGGTGVTDASGKYTLQGPRGQAGVSAGDYKVVISKRVMPDGSPGPAGVGAEDSPARQTLPARFSDVQATELQARVAPGGAPIDFPLKTR